MLQHTRQVRSNESWSASAQGWECKLRAWFFLPHTHTPKNRNLEGMELKHEESLPVVKSHRTFVIGMAWRPCQVLQFDAFNWRAHLRTFNFFQLFQHTAHCDFAVDFSFATQSDKYSRYSGSVLRVAQRVGLHAGRFGLGALLLEPHSESVDATATQSIKMDQKCHLLYNDQNMSEWIIFPFKNISLAKHWDILRRSCNTWKRNRPWQFLIWAWKELRTWTRQRRQLAGTSAQAT